MPGVQFEWTSDNEDLDIPNDNSILRNNTSYAPPYKDTWYVLTATDNLGMTVKDSVFYESIQTRATFRMEYWDKVALAWDGDLTSTWTKDQGSLDAPLTVRFRNESLNGVQFDWTLLDTLGGIPVTDVTTDTSQFVEFVYRTANKYYYPTLVSTSEEACTDTFELESPLFVAPSQLAIPNVFSPNGDLANDIWYFKHQSLQSCKVTVVDRTGKIMYRKKIDDIYLWEGWDGNVHETNRKAPEGQYYYIVEALGYDGVEYKDPTIIENWRTNRGGSATTGGTGTDGETAAQTVYTGWLYLFRGVGEY
ncbi:MAG: gliding motility-associated C-terminal domain-containing protein [Bacteroidales bacterium]